MPLLWFVIDLQIWSKKLIHYFHYSETSLTKAAGKFPTYFMTIINRLRFVVILITNYFKTLKMPVVRVVTL